MFRGSQGRDGMWFAVCLAVGRAEGRSCRGDFVGWDPAVLAGSSLCGELPWKRGVGATLGVPLVS